MKTIYFIDECQSSKVNGIGTYRRSLIYCLRHTEVKIRTISFNDDVLEFKIENKEDITNYRIPALPNGSSIISHPQIINRLMRLHIADTPNNIFYFNHSPCDRLLEIIRESFPMSKLILTIHDMGWCVAFDGNEQKFREVVSSRRNKSIRKKHVKMLEYYDAERKMYSIVDKVVCLSHSTYRVLKDIYKVDTAKIAFIPNGMEKISLSSPQKTAEELRRELLFEKDEKILISVGRLSRAKGALSLIQAFVEVLKKHPKTRLVFAGLPQKEQLDFFALSGSVAAKVSLTGHISREELFKLYRIADIGIMPSLTEQCSYVGMEMMLHGLPVVASDANGVKDMFPDGICSKTASIGNRDDKSEYVTNLSNAISLLLEDANLRNRLGENATKWFDANYDISLMKDKYEKLFTEL
jgi:glycosyltransferase